MFFALTVKLIFVNVNFPLNFPYTMCLLTEHFVKLKSVIFLLCNLEAISSNFPAIRYARTRMHFMHAYTHIRMYCMHAMNAMHSVCVQGSCVSTCVHAFMCLYVCVCVLCVRVHSVFVRVHACMLMCVCLCVDACMHT